MSQLGISANRLELLQIADSVAREKAIDRMVVIGAMEDAIQRAARSRYGSENEIRAQIDPTTGEILLSRLLEVVETVEMDAVQISLKEAIKRNPEAILGDFISEPLPPVDFGRIAAQNAKQVIVQKVREAERERQYEEFKDRVGEIVHGVVKRVEYGNIIVDLGRGEAVVRRDEALPRENFRTAMGIASVLIFSTFVRNSAGHRYSCHAPILNSWPNCSRRKCRKFMMVSLKLNRSRAIPAAGPR